MFAINHFNYRIIPGNWPQCSHLEFHHLKLPLSLISAVINQSYRQETIIIIIKLRRAPRSLRLINRKRDYFHPLILTLLKIRNSCEINNPVLSNSPLLISESVSNLLLLISSVLLAHNNCLDRSVRPLHPSTAFSGQRLLGPQLHRLLFPKEQSFSFGAHFHLSPGV